MAKQRGLHQISGKVNNLCYYEQKYVKGGLIRRINEAMSERLKTDPVFDRTRYANTIFGGCSMVAGVLLSFFGSRNTFLFKPYRHALLTRAILEKCIRWDSTEEYPIIFERNKVYNALPYIISRIVKNSIFNSFLEIENRYPDLIINDTKDFTFNYESLVSFCKKYKCVGVQLSISRPYYMYQSNYLEDEKKYQVPENNPGGRGAFVNWYLGDGDGNVTLTADTGDIDDTSTFWILYATPILRTYQNRPVLGETGASCGVVSYSAR